MTTTAIKNMKTNIVHELPWVVYKKNEKWS